MGLEGLITTIPIPGLVLFVMRTSTIFNPCADTHTVISKTVRRMRYTADA